MLHDVGMVDYPGSGTPRRWFINVAGAGYDAHVIGAGAAAGAVGVHLPEGRAQRAGVATGPRDSGSTPTVRDSTTGCCSRSSANAQYCGNRMHVAPVARVDDGLLDVVMVRERRAARRAAEAREALPRHHPRRPRRAPPARGEGACRGRSARRDPGRRPDGGPDSCGILGPAPGPAGRGAAPSCHSTNARRAGDGGVMSLTTLLTHRGGCHCGAVAFEVDAPAHVTVQDCSCSICSMTGYLHLIVPAARFRLLRGTDMLRGLHVQHRHGTASFLPALRDQVLLRAALEPRRVQRQPAMRRPLGLRARGGRAVRRTELGAGRCRARAALARVTGRQATRSFRARASGVHRSSRACGRPRTLADTTGMHRRRRRARSRASAARRAERLLAVNTAASATPNVTAATMSTSTSLSPAAGCAPPCLAGRVHCGRSRCLHERRPRRHPRSSRFACNFPLAVPWYRSSARPRSPVPVSHGRLL